MVDDQFFCCNSYLLKEQTHRNFSATCNGEVYEHFDDDFIIEESCKHVDDLCDENYILKYLVQTKKNNLDKEVVNIVEKNNSFHFKLVDPMESQKVTIGGRHHSEHTNV